MNDNNKVFFANSPSSAAEKITTLEGWDEQ